MAMFVHITAAKFEKAIRRSGIGGSKAMLSGARFKRGFVFCFPVLESHTLTHQWTREILKWRRQPLVAIYFRLPDDEPVLCGRYLDRPRPMTAAEAVGVIRAHQGMDGWEVLLERNVAVKEITRIAPVRGVIGWRHSVNARGREPCPCEYCQRGQPNSRRIVERRRLEDERLDAERARSIAAVEAQIERDRQAD